jgi:hypothetical protein
MSRAWCVSSGPRRFRRQPALPCDHFNDFNNSYLIVESVSHFTTINRNRLKATNFRKNCHDTRLWQKQKMEASVRIAVQKAWLKRWRENLLILGFPARSLLVNGTRSAYHTSVICSCGAASDEIQIDETSADDGTLPDSRLHQR